MTVDHDLLRSIHRMHRQKNDLHSRIERGPKQLNASNKKVDEAETAISEQKTDIKKAQRLSQEKQGLLKQREDKILDLKGKLNSAKSNEEFQAFKNQIAAEEQANEVLSDEILELLERIDGMEEKLTELEAELKSVQAERDKIKKRVEKKQLGLSLSLRVFRVNWKNRKTSFRSISRQTTSELSSLATKKHSLSWMEMSAEVASRKSR